MRNTPHFLQCEVLKKALNEAEPIMKMGEGVAADHISSVMEERPEKRRRGGRDFKVRINA